MALPIGWNGSDWNQKSSMIRSDEKEQHYQSIYQDSLHGKYEFSAILTKIDVLLNYLRSQFPV